MTSVPQSAHVQGDRVSLVPQDADIHLESYIRWLNDPDVTRWLLRYMPLTRLEERRWFEQALKSTDDVTWAVHDENGRHIGSTGLHRINWHDRMATSGIVIGERDAWGRGYGAEIMRVRTRWAFEELGLHRIESECFAENVASARCLEKAGYRRFGTARKRHWRGGRWHDAILWEILDEDYFGS